MSQYSEYKNSGIESIGNIPIDWDCLRISRVLKHDASGIMVGPFGSSLTNVVVGHNDGKYKIYGQANLIRKDFTYGDKYVTEETYKSLNNYEVISGDVAVSMMGTIGKCCVIPNDIEKGIMDSHLIKIRLGESINPYFFEYIYESEAVYKQIMAQSKGSIMTGLNSSIVKSLYIALPSLSEQTAIANYLDKFTANIDAIISDMQASIEEYKAWRSSIIYETVTKGLDPNIEMKDSGVAWIGIMPTTWECMRLKLLVDHCTNKSDNNLNYIGLENVESATGKFIEGSTNNFEAEGTSLSVLQGDILFGKLRPYLAKCVIANKNCCCSSEFIVMHAKKCNPRFIQYAILSPKFIDTVNMSTYGAKMPRANWEFVGNMVLPVPPIEIQKNICDFLDSNLQKIDSLIYEKESLISDLEAYKKSLIYEVVTGKRKVV